VLVDDPELRVALVVVLARAPRSSDGQPLPCARIDRTCPGRSSPLGSRFVGGGSRAVRRESPWSWPRSGTADGAAEPRRTGPASRLLALVVTRREEKHGEGLGG
jgi:hypothetical protein